MGLPSRESVRRLATLAALALAAAGCATPEAPPVGEALRAVKPAAAPADWRLAVAPVEVRLAAALGPASPDDEYWSPIPVDAAAIRGLGERAAKESNAFAAVDFDRSLERFEGVPASADAGGAGRGGAGGAGSAGVAAAPERPPALPVPASLTARVAFPVAEPPPGGHVAGVYFERDADLLLTLRVARHSVAYVERNGAYVPSLVFLYAMWIWPAWLVADEVYEAEVLVEVELRAVSADRAIWTKTYRARARGDLGCGERGFMFTGPLTVPYWLEADNYRAAGERLMPAALNDVAAELKRDLAAATLTREEQVRAGVRRGAPASGGGGAAKIAPSGVSGTAAAATPPPSRDEIEAGLPATLVVAIGAPKVVRSPVLPPRAAAAEAEEVALLFLDPNAGGLPARNVSRITELRSEAAYDGAPHRLGAIAKIRQRAERARARDTLVVYFAGAGFASGDELFLVPRDLDVKDPRASAIGLADLERVLATCAARQVVVVDASFDGEVKAGSPVRTVAPDLLRGLAPSSPERVRAALERFAAKHHRRVVIVAAEPGTAVPELSPLPEDEKGLFTARLVAAARTRATDANKDGSISLLEAFTACKRETTRTSAMSGEPQVPAIFPAADAEARAGAVALCRARVEAAAK